MAAIALPRLRAPKLDLSRLRSPRVAMAGAGVLFVAALATVIMLLAPMASGAHRHPLPQVPAAWKTALRPPAKPAHLYPDVVRLSERPLTGAARSAPDRAPAPIILAGTSLPQAPLAGFYAETPGGPLPIIAADGRTPAEAYARPFVANGRPKVAMVVGGLGLNSRTTRQAIETLRPEITLAFVVYAPDLQGWIDLARARGHEVLIEAPMEPMDFPENDPGPYALMADSPPQETAKRLDWILSRAAGYFGVTNYLGARFLAADTAYAAFTNGLRSRGVAFVDDGQAARRGGGVPRASAERIIDAGGSSGAISEQLAALEAGAQQRGQALGSGFAYPATLERVAQWAAEVEQRGFQLAPASALLARR